MIIKKTNNKQKKKINKVKNQGNVVVVVVKSAQKGVINRVTKKNIFQIKKK